MSTDNRYLRNDCENNTGWAGDDTANAISSAGSFIEGSGALSTQLSNADERMSTTRDTTAAGTFSVNFSDRTVYANIKDNLSNTYANNGHQIVLGDGTDEIGYSVGGNDARGVTGQLFFTAFKLDCSESLVTPGNFATYSGSEGNLSYTVITQIGYGSNHLAKAVGSVDNVIMDGFYDIANGSYALTINGGTAGTPETMADVVTDDEASGWHMVFNPLGSQYVFFAPTEFGNATNVAEHALTATNEQWFWVGDNAGGRAVGATHFPFRVIGNSTDTGSFIITNVVIVNTGTPSEFDCSSSEVNTLEIDGCSMDGLASFGGPASGGTSRFCTNTNFLNSGQVTNNGADMDGCSVISSTVAADVGALLYNEASDPDGTLDNMTFESGAAAHHAIDFGTNVDSSLTSITLRGIAFNGFGATDDANASTVRFLATTGSLTLNLIDCTVDGISPVASGGSQNFSVDDAAGMTVTVVVQPVTLTINVKEDNAGLAPIQNVQTSIHLKDSPFTELMNEDTTAGGVATESYAGTTPVDIVWKTRKSDDLDTPRYIAKSGVATITSDGLTVDVLLKENTFI